jgi:large subunit ribosomal protein L19
MNQIILDFQKSQIKSNRPVLNPGDLVRVEQQLEKSADAKEKVARKSIFEGVVIQVRNPNSLNATFTLRKVSFGIGVEKVFPLHSPTLSKIEVLKKNKVRRAKLYYLRERFGKKARMKDQKIDSKTLSSLGWDQSDEAPTMEAKAEESTNDHVEEVVNQETSAEVMPTKEAKTEDEIKVEDDKPKK